MHIHKNQFFIPFLPDQKLKVSISEWYMSNTVTGRIVARNIAHALGIKLDFLKAPANPPSFNGISVRYDSEGKPCTNVSGLMDQGYKNDVDKFTGCSRDDYKFYYNKVLQTYGTFCLDFSKLIMYISVAL